MRRRPAARRAGLRTATQGAAALLACRYQSALGGAVPAAARTGDKPVADHPADGYTACPAGHTHPAGIAARSTAGGFAPFAREPVHAAIGASIAAADTPGTTPPAPQQSPPATPGKPAAPAAPAGKPTGS